MKRECSHTDGHHVHGTRAAYVKDRCRCTDCTAANTAASRLANRERSYGRWQPYVDAHPVHEHIAALRAAGIGVERIAHLAGMALSHVRELADPGVSNSTVTRRVRPTTAARILSIGMDDANRASHSRVDATGTRRRLQALIATGWAPELLAAQLGRRPNSLNRSMTSPSVTARTAQDVVDLYERLWNTPPPRGTGEQRAAANAARAHAAAQGWEPPLAWDDIDADPTPQPTAGTPPSDDVDLIAVERALIGDGIRYDDLTFAEQQEVIHRLTARGRSIRDIAAQLATTKRTVSRRRASVDGVCPGR
ncbi:helix-turn-helix domain-containing protein [Modestobacter sp. DSM 44400]|uniref:helix-turn-helix domain-containing protein n=1 Tax=Modestobacter sp. DSM 44400 TaxID=1550230 RepID=UPI0020C88AC3|nr:helix-turn-helix domain-containing protein [Modestobacter sp. DSM 44400]